MKELKKNINMLSIDLYKQVKSFIFPLLGSIFIAKKSANNITKNSILGLIGPDAHLIYLSTEVDGSYRFLSRESIMNGYGKMYIYVNEIDSIKIIHE
tara:strand:- start:718 stop:1008 length:291 start_codon:yes stop_codon:yes gene_type:complete